MRKVFSSNQACIHAFAQRNQSEGRASSVFFYGDKCYSYGRHYELARFIEGVDGSVAIRINDRGYSNSTAKHIGLMRNATRQYRQFFETHTDEQILKNKFYDLFKLKAKARKPEKYMSEAAYLWEKYVEYCIFMGYNTDAEVEHLYSRVCGANAEEYAKQYLEEEKRKKAQKLLEAKEQLNKFFNYEVHNVYGLSEDYCRISLDGSVVRTTQGCEVPVEDAKVLWSLIKAGRDIKGVRVGQYTVIGLNGHLKIGCHHINTNNMKEIGAKLEML